MAQSIGKTPEERSATFWRLKGEGKQNVFVAWYLMASYSYYVLNESWMEDSDFDFMCFEMLYKRFDNVVHPHKYLLDKDALLAGTGYQIKELDYPRMTRCAAWAVLHPEDPLARNMPNA